jgi:hypothetical protein
MILKSEMLSNVLKILLWVLLLLTVLDLAGAFIFSSNADFYIDLIYDLNNFISLIATVLYFVIAVIYLIWIYRVHMDLNNYFANYSRSPGMALACMMVPFFNFYGLPSTYLRIGEYFSQYATGLEKQGQWIRGLAVPLILLFFLLSGINNSMSDADAESIVGLWIAAGITELIIYSIFLYLCISISYGLKQLQAKKNALNNQIPAEWNVPAQPVPSTESV